MPNYRNADDVYTDLSRRINREPDPKIWDHLVRKRYITEMVAEEDAITMEELVAEYRGLEQLRGNDSHRPRIEREVPPDKRGEALSRILAIEAAQGPDVQRFRKRLLDDKLLTWEEAVSWIEEQHRTAGRPTMYAVVPVPEEANEDEPFAWLKQAAQKSLKEKSTWPVAYKVKTIDYARPGDSWVHRLPVSIGSPLDQLRVISERLAKAYHWPPAAATVFVLTGAEYLIPRARITTTIKSPFSALRTISIEVLASVPVREVTEIYADARRRLLGPGGRDPAITKEWRAELAVFVAEHNDGRSWREAMKIWNEKHPERRCDNPSTFARDGRQAYEKITGSRLFWGKDKNSPASG
ncbi:MAG: hypothetical protein KJ650_08105 [Firmicutes bacterium]|nr:hypothetical protein [Bacillota bacterium]MBU4553737.1 hypothetical protein [Bacillota bacterium]MBV1728470.1 hypothetical protein [Desulforudis sp.]MBV1735759.1 hypothetical protein [Desulforudis sp.]MBV1770105.1 hypothetical protein [Desulforudis sp.]